MLKIVAIALLSTVAYAQQGPATTTTAANGTQRVRQQPSKAKKLTRVEADSLFAHPDQILVIDVRRPDEIAAIGGFPVYLSIQIKDLKDHLNEIPKDKLIVTVSDHTGRSGQAADLLASNGFKVAGALGAQTYEAEGGTLLKLAAPAPKTVAEGQK